ncbi:MAG: FAD-binding oxidoreductase [Cytophagales bacterium]|nr:MAG: FAD-binding oxidoreductase [Cytophagales bacterium]
MLQELQTLLPNSRVKTRLIDRYAYASDASHFYLVPQAIAQPVTIEEIQKLFQFSHRHNLHMTFRAGGTSVSGQGVTDGLLVDLSNHWRRVTPENGGETVRVEPAVIGANVNIHLKKYGRKIGPDPASINACMMGGILSNNSSGMCCGVAQNAYHTLRSMTFVLPNGQVFNTERPREHDRFLNEAPDLAEGLRQLRRDLLANTTLVERIHKKYRQKNTVGYSLNAFVDFEHPLDILTHLIIGGEGTLAFIAEAVLNTVPDLPYKITGMLYFESPEVACNAIPALISTGAAALEFMDRASLRSVETMPGVPAFLKTLPEGVSAILCEFQETTNERVWAQYEAAKATFTTLPLLMEPTFTQNATEQALLWKIRKGMYPSVAGMRAKGTSALMEDFTFPVERLGEAVVDVQRLFDKYGYHNGIIFGHAKDGNLHFIISQSYATQPDIDHYERFNDEVFRLVLDKYDGALKAEHSTGRAVSAYVEDEWGPDAYQIMKRLKTLVDPRNLLNPGIIITDDKLAHVHNLKVMPIVEEEVDKCIECGFCEQSCPSRDLTLTPRRRIGVRRAIKRAEMAGDTVLRTALLADYTFEGLDTCATDGLCATNCPVDINTGDLVKRLRRENHSPFQNRLALLAARRFALLEGAARGAVSTGTALNRVFGPNFMRNLTETGRKIAPGLPLWMSQLTPQLPKGGLVRHESKPPLGGWGSGKPMQQLSGNATKTEIVYFSSCISRMMGGDIMTRFQSVCQKAGISVVLPATQNGTCCGQIFSSKGYADAYRFTANETIEKLFVASQKGKLPLVMDVTSCTQTLKGCRPYLTDANKVLFDAMTFLDAIEFAADHLLPRLTITKPKTSVVFHPVCSAQKMGLLPKLQAIGNACAHQADIPTFAGCCGMAGDRGFYYPELTRAATNVEAAEVKQKTYDGYYSSSKTCEMALSDAVGKNYESILTLLDEVS